MTYLLILVIIRYPIFFKLRINFPILAGIAKDCQRITSMIADITSVITSVVSKLQYSFDKIIIVHLSICIIKKAHTNRTKIFNNFSI